MMKGLRMGYWGERAVKWHVGERKSAKGGYKNPQGREKSLFGAQQKEAESPRFSAWQKEHLETQEERKHQKERNRSRAWWWKRQEREEKGWEDYLMGGRKLEGEASITLTRSVWELQTQCNDQIKLSEVPVTHSLSTALSGFSTFKPILLFTKSNTQRSDGEDNFMCQEKGQKSNWVLINISKRSHTCREEFSNVHNKLLSLENSNSERQWNTC